MGKKRGMVHWGGGYGLGVWKAIRRGVASC